MCNLPSKGVHRLTQVPVPYSSWFAGSLQQEEKWHEILYRKVHVCVFIAQCSFKHSVWLIKSEWSEVNHTDPPYPKSTWIGQP